MSPTNGGLVRRPGSSPATQKTPEDLILDGALDLDELVDNIEQTVFLLDISSSMNGYITSDDWSWDDPPGSRETKISLLKKALSRYIRTRFEKKPDSRVGMVAFETNVHVLVDITDDEQELLRRAETLRGRGTTKMDKGLARAIGLLKKSSKSWIPRIVLISDGAPDNQKAVVRVIENNKHLRIIIDALYIGSEDERDNMYIQFMRELAERTGGVFEQIASEEEFEAKLLGVANRPLLGAAKPQLTGNVQQHRGGVIQL